MSSSRQQSNNSNHNNLNELIDYDLDQSSNAQRPSRQQVSGHVFNNRGQSHGNDFYEPMHAFHDDTDEDLPNEIVTAFAANDRIRSNRSNVDESVFSDVVQDAFKKYQNEYSKYWTSDDTMWDNRFFDEEQEELYAQMEECWNYMAQESAISDSSKASAGQSQANQLNPDAIEFKPTWLQSSSTSTNEGPSVSLPSSHSEDQSKNI